MQKRGYQVLALAVVSVLFLSLAIVSAFSFSDFFGNLFGKNTVTGNVVGENCPSGLAGYYKFEGNVQDSSGSNTNGNLIGSPLSISGKVGNAYSFNGIANNYVNVACSGSNLPIGANPWSAFTWIKFGAWNGAEHALGIFTLGDDSGHGIYFNLVGGPSWCPSTSGLDFAVSARPHNCISVSGLADGNWHYVGLTYNGTTVQLYSDGTSMGTVSINLNLLCNKFNVGATGNGQFNGNIDEVSIWNKALSQGEITDLYNSGSGKDACSQVQPAICAEDWQCTTWGACTDNKQTRTCTDSNNCLTTTTTNKPIITQGCTVQNATQTNATVQNATQTNATTQTNCTVPAILPCDGTLVSRGFDLRGCQLPPICIEGNNISQSNSCSGCLFNNVCLPIGYRFNNNGFDSYCDIFGIGSQKINAEGLIQTCQNDFECSTNLCSEGKCVSLEGFRASIVRVVCRISTIFSGTYESCINENIYGVPICGDNKINTQEEECDGSDLNNQTCQSNGFNSGRLSCSSSCKIDTSGCTIGIQGLCANVQCLTGLSCNPTNGRCEVQYSSIKVLIPNGQERWQTGTTQQITWNSPSTITNVDILLNSSSGRLTFIASNIANSGSYNWIVRNPTNEPYKVIVRNHANFDQHDESDNWFAINNTIITSCTNECSSSGIQQCSGNGYQICGNYDSDSCLELSVVDNCASGQTCNNGICTTPSCTLVSNPSTTPLSVSTISSGHMEVNYPDQAYVVFEVLSSGTIHTLCRINMDSDVTKHDGICNLSQSSITGQIVVSIVSAINNNTLILETNLGTKKIYLPAWDSSINCPNGVCNPTNNYYVASDGSTYYTKLLKFISQFSISNLTRAACSETTCSDPDGTVVDSNFAIHDNSVYTRTSVTWNGQNTPDTCIDATRLSERFCISGGGSASTSYDCPLGCLNGACNKTSGTPNTCTTLNAKQCSGNGYQICQRNPINNVLQWSAVNDCAPGQTCSNGVCAPICSGNLVTDIAYNLFNPDCLPRPVCGNNIVETGEQCDDGNTVNGDGCSSTCQIEGEQVIAFTIVGNQITATSGELYVGMQVTATNSETGEVYTGIVTEVH